MTCCLRCCMSMEKSFASLSYGGTFRDYQRHLMKNLEDRLDERKLNIVTPPGSGKIVLGLELVRRIGEPCLVISSTEVMRNHWVENFVSSFDEAIGHCHYCAILFFGCEGGNIGFYLPGIFQYFCGGNHSPFTLPLNIVPTAFPATMS